MFLALRADGPVVITPHINNHFLKELQHEFKEAYKDAEYYLRADIKKMRSNDIAINEQNYADEVMDRFNMNDPNHVYTLMEKGNLSRDDTVGFGSEQSLTDSSKYMIISSRSDIAFAVSYFSQLSEKTEHKYCSIIK